MQRPCDKYGAKVIRRRHEKVEALEGWRPLAGRKLPENTAHGSRLLTDKSLVCRGISRIATGWIVRSGRRLKRSICGGQ